MQAANRSRRRFDAEGCVALTETADRRDATEHPSRASALDLAVLDVFPLTAERRGTTLRNTKSVAERLAAAAVSLFAEHGFDHVTVEDVASRAGVTARTFFRYFPSKETVIVDIHDLTNLRLVTLIEAAPSHGEVQYSVRRACEQWCEEYEDLLAAIGELTADSTTLNAALLLRTTTWERRLIQALAHRFPDLAPSGCDVWGMIIMAMLRLVAHRAHTLGMSYTDSAREVFAGLDTLMTPAARHVRGTKRMSE